MPVNVVLKEILKGIPELLSPVGKGPVSELLSVIVVTTYVSTVSVGRFRPLISRSEVIKDVLVFVLGKELI